jgi:SAM-dependent methyltransferase
LFNLEFLGLLRTREMEELTKLLPKSAVVLEFGAGTGEQAKILTSYGYEVVAIDLRGGAYSEHRVFPVIDYDGDRLPLDDHSFDVVFSSNVLEHVEDLPRALRELARVLKPDGFAVHVMPTPSWRFWTFVAGVPTSGAAVWKLVSGLVSPPPATSRASAARSAAKAFMNAVLPIGHGTSWEGISELWTFSRTWWRHRFLENGYDVVSDRPIGLFYTGHMALGKRLGMDARKRLSRTLGSATHVYVVRPSR